MRFSKILHYVQNDREKAKRIKQTIQQVKSQFGEMLDGMQYRDALFFTSHIVRFLNAYLDARSPVEVYRVIAAWEFDETCKPHCIRATVDAAAFTGLDRASHMANTVVLIEKVANAIMPKTMPLKAKLGKGGIIKLSGKGETKAVVMKRCMNAMQLQQKALLNRKSKMH